VKNITVFNIGEPPQFVVYLPFDQDYQPFAVVHIRTTSDPAHVLPSAMAAVQSIDHDLALLNPVTARDVIGQALWAPHMAAGLFGLFGALSLVLAIVGVYGVMAYIVLQRTTEIGIRMALGAHPSNVLQMIFGQSMRLAGLGILAGLAGALAFTRLLANLLFDVSPNDPATFIVVAAVLSVTALLAAGIPAWRAARIDPVSALRQE
jgi:putative ABC transport system permease protein